ncbi:MAG: 30S ribosomal protein S17 [Nitrospinota bacterium]|nr:30S ribosomal protein S17 [Nitrospinota bacterium]MDH5790202.1 30S ribosomal protein S17 [Nitrospinota bacterium]
MSQEVESNKRVITGTVVSNKMDKTVVVSVERKFIHRTFKKVVKRTKKFKCHDEKNECSVGDFISMREVRPLSKTKRWNLEKVLKTAQAV